MVSAALSATILDDFTTAKALDGIVLVVRAKLFPFSNNSSIDEQLDGVPDFLSRVAAFIPNWDD